jgi:hypothetical protein
VKFSLLGQDLHETAEQAKRFFSESYGATRFRCEEPISSDLPLRPTWQAKMKNGYMLCINVQPSPFSESLYEFVTRGAQKGMPIKLWVAVAAGAAKESFSSDLKKAHEAGIGVVQIEADGSAHECHRAVPLSLFGLKRTKLATIPAARREEVKSAEDAYLDGHPEKGCQAICQELEAITRKFAEAIYGKGWWITPAGSTPHRSRFFQIDSWATMLEEMERRTDYRLMKAKAPKFTKNLILTARAYTDWRNTVSHKPRTLSELQARDEKLRTMFEATRDSLLGWYEAAKPLRLL